MDQDYQTIHSIHLLHTVHHVHRIATAKFQVSLTLRVTILPRYGGDWEPYEHGISHPIRTTPMISVTISPPPLPTVIPLEGVGGGDPYGYGYGYSIDHGCRRSLPVYLSYMVLSAPIPHRGIYLWYW